MTAEKTAPTHDQKWRSIRSTLWLRIGQWDGTRGISGSKIIRLMIEAREADIVSGVDRLYGVKRNGRIKALGHEYARIW